MTKDYVVIWAALTAAEFWSAIFYFSSTGSEHNFWFYATGSFAVLAICVVGLSRKYGGDKRE